MTMSKPLLRAKGLVQSYRVKSGLLSGARELHALKGIDLTINRGEIVGLVGESGCGKSTLARILLGLEQPVSGTVEVDGVPVTQADKRARARRIQPVFQDPYGSLNPSMIIRDIIALPLKVHQICPADERMRRVARLADQVGLPARLLDAVPGELSGGQRQRVAIARALIIEPELLICDEPTSALDVSVQAQILNLLMDLRRDTGVAMLFISHDLAVVEYMTDRMFVMYLGQIVETGPTADVFSAPGHHYTMALQQSVFSPDDDAGLPTTRLKGNPPSPLDPPTGCAFHPRCEAATGTCREISPELVDLRKGGLCACHFPLGVDSGNTPLTRSDPHALRESG
ncbi:ATP-binding cassette domain-containing protein [Rhodobacteraceae bacterium F11138]|nr:ATP-binding cassette domain-containing protein [Rhodobacteraceae bacterium F11138]